MTTYSIAQLNSFYFETPEKYTLDKSFLDILLYIEKNIDIPEYDRVPVPAQSWSKKPEKKSHKKKEPNPDDWEIMRNFKSTKFETKTGIDKIINDIRNKLNNISTTTYDKHKTGIIEIVNEFISDNEDDDDYADNIQKLATSIFEISSKSKFNSALYAQLYKELVALHSIFGEMITQHLKTIEESFHKIVYVDPNVDYDGFCEYTKQNEQRISATLFYTNLMKQDLVDKSVVLSLIMMFILYIEGEFHHEGKTPILENITENLFVLVSSTISELKQHEDWQTIIEKIKTISAYKNKMFPSISNRIIFKFMDMRDLIEKS